MNRLPRGLPLLLLLPLAGCAGAGSSATMDATPAAGPHGGPLVALPAGSGFGEVVLESAGARSGQVQIVAYFLDPDLSAPLATPPEAVKVALDFPDGHAETVDLAPAPKGPGDGGGRFASKAGAFDVDPPMGELSGTLDGRPFSGRFAGAR